VKIWHVAALALTGRYLMMPPPLSRSRDRLVPLSQWTTTSSFESKKACEAERDHFSKLDPGAEVAGNDPPRTKYTTLSVSLPTIRLKP
jgi:hypothetical protein